MKYGDLPNKPKLGIALFCPLCHTNYSATRGDYWQRLDEQIGTCSTCGHGKPLILARTVRKLVKVKPAEAERQP